MRRDEFSDGLREIQAALQGNFLPGFVDVLQRSVEKTPSQIWKGAVLRIATGRRSATELRVGDFLEAIADARHEQAQAESRWKLRPEKRGSPDWTRLHESVERDPGALEGSKAIASYLAGRKAPGKLPERPKGGEKHRGKDRVS